MGPLVVSYIEFGDSSLVNDGVDDCVKSVVLLNG
jgi:hypothetical protein